MSLILMLKQQVRRLSDKQLKDIKEITEKEINRRVIGKDGVKGNTRGGNSVCE